MILDADTEADGIPTLGGQSFTQRRDYARYVKKTFSHSAALCQGQCYQTTERTKRSERAFVHHSRAYGT